MSDASQVRINELARELEVKAKAIIDLLPGFGVSEKKTHSSSIPVDVAERVRQAIRGSVDAEAAEAVAKRPVAPAPAAPTPSTVKPTTPALPRRAPAAPAPAGHAPAAAPPAATKPAPAAPVSIPTPAPAAVK